MVIGSGGPSRNADVIPDIIRSSATAHSKGAIDPRSTCHFIKPPYAILRHTVRLFVIVGAPVVPAQPHLTTTDIDEVVSTVTATELPSETATELLAAATGIAPTALAVSAN